MPGVSEAVRAAIAAGRGASGETHAAWRAGPEYRALAASFADCPAEDLEAVAERGEVLLADTGWVEALLAPLQAVLAADPFFEPPFRFSRDASRTGAVLFECPAVTVTANVVTAPPAPGRVTFTGRMTVTRYVRSGGATLRRWRAEAMGPNFSVADASPCRELATVVLNDGEVHRCDGRTEAQMPVDAGSPVVMLAVVSRTGSPLLREYCVADGQLARLVSGDDRPSRAEMLLTFVRLAGRADAGERFDTATRDDAFNLRWAAMREWLLLDARGALARLVEMAHADPSPDIRSAAARTLVTVERRLTCPA
jgi:hypothetical protein